MKKSIFNYPVGLITFSLVGLIAAFWQVADRIHSLQYPEDPLSCNLNPVLDCGTVADHSLASLFGMPNTMIGMVIFSSLVVTGIYLLVGNNFNARAQQIVLGLASAIMAFAVWFYAMSLYVIGAICLFCIPIWIVAVPLWTLTVREYGLGLITNKAIQKSIKKHPGRYILVMYVIAVLLYIFRFREYYFG